MAPIFMQFIDCVWQLTHQFPCSFEFNEDFLIFLIDAVYSCQFGTFLLNSESQRKEANLERLTVSVWSFIAQRQDRFLNPFFDPLLGSENSIDGSHLLLAASDPRDLVFWRSYYLRYHALPFASKSVSERFLEMQRENELLRMELNALKRSA